MSTARIERLQFTTEARADSPGNGTRPEGTGMPLAIEQLVKDKYVDWDAYIRKANGGLPLHLAAWRDVMQKTYGYKTLYLMAYRGDAVAGVLPLFIVPSRITGRRAMTMPGGLCADNDQVARNLIEGAQASLAALNIKQINLHDARQTWLNKDTSSNRHVYWLVKLQPSEEALWQGLDGNIRRQVRKARKNGLTVDVDRTGRLLDPFYQVFSRFTHQAGTPVFGQPFLANVIEAFPKGFNIVVVWHQERPVAGYFQLEMNNTVYGMWGASLYEFRNLRPAYLAIWEILKDAVNKGFSFLDMGRSPAGSNASRFKGQWGGVAHPVYQQVFLDGDAGQNASANRSLQSEDRYQAFMKLWQRMPYGLASSIGPKLRWHIPFG